MQFSKALIAAVVACGYFATPAFAAPAEEVSPLNTTALVDGYKATIKSDFNDNVDSMASSNTPLCSSIDTSVDGTITCLEPYSSLINGTQVGMNDPFSPYLMNFAFAGNTNDKKTENGNGNGNLVVNANDYRTPLYVDEVEKTTKWCFSQGPKRDQKAMEKLCDKIPDDFVLRRARFSAQAGDPEDLPAVCRKWTEGNSAFQICNFDRCSALKFESGLQNICRSIASDCTGQSSGYIKYPSYQAREFALSDGTGKKHKFDSESGVLDPLLKLKGMGETTCEAGNEFRDEWWMDYTGPLIQCEKRNWFTNLFHRHVKCWRITDPEHWWKEKVHGHEGGKPGHHDHGRHKEYNH